MNRIEIPDDEVELSFARSGGPGGQHVNTAETKAVLRWNVTASPTVPDDVRARFLTLHAGRITAEGVLVLHCDGERSQRRNVEACRALLQRLVDEATTPPKPRKRTRPSRAAVERRLEQKARKSETKAARRPPEV